MKDRSGGIEHRRAFAADFDADMDFLQVNEIGGDASNTRRGRGIEVGPAQEAAKLVGLDLMVSMEVSRTLT